MCVNLKYGLVCDRFDGGGMSVVTVHVPVSLLVLTQNGVKTVQDIGF